VQVVDATTNEIVYTLRTKLPFRPKVFAPGRYTIRVGEPGTPNWRELEGIEATPDNDQELMVEF
jgi:hypothetical protein